MTELLDAADSSPESLRLEPKWLRVTYTYETAKHEMMEWMEAAKYSSLMRNKTEECEKLWIEWKQNLCWEYLDNAGDLCENALSHDFDAILVLLDICTNFDAGYFEVCPRANTRPTPRPCCPTRNTPEILRTSTWTLRRSSDERIRALIHERKTCGKHNKDRIREISKEIKKYIRENKRLKRQEKFKKSWKKYKSHEKHQQHQIGEETNSYPKGEKQRRRSCQN